MDLGGKIRRARLEAGLSQRQLCGEEITRNMLSLIENGSARPSMKTLTILAEKLGKPLSFFLDENGEDNAALVSSAEYLRRADEALAEGKFIFAENLLKSVTAPELQREKLLLAAKIPGASAAEIVRFLPSVDEELLLRAEAAFQQQDWNRCAVLLAAAEDWENPARSRLVGRMQLAQGNYAEAVSHLLRVEKVWPEETARDLEICFRELGDFRRAYEYACKQRETK